MTYTELELEFLSSQSVARLATVSPDGVVQNNPVGFRVNPDDGTIDVGGMKLTASRKARNVEAGSRVALVADELVSLNPYTVRGVEIRGTAELIQGEKPPFPAFQENAVIRIRPARILAWGIDTEGFVPTGRNVP